MADIELVIKIPDEAYNLLKTSGVDWLGAEHILNAVANGTPLPKGHGRIAEMDAAIKCIDECEGDDAIWAISLIEWACDKRTIIEAERKE